MGLKLVENIVKTKKTANILNFLLVFFLWGSLLSLCFLNFKSVSGGAVGLIFIAISVVVFCLIQLFSVVKFYKKRQFFIIFFNVIPFFIILFFLLVLIYFEGLSRSSFGSNFGF